MTGVAIDGDRFLDDLRTLRTFGATGTGVVRPSLSPIDMAARRWLCERLADAGLDASIDGVGNVIGRSPNPGPALLIGSHSDTQPTGGWLDGAYGVIVAVEVARVLLADPTTSDLAIDVVAWVDEESTFVSCLGSRSFCGLVGDDEIEAATDPDGLSLRAAWAAAGLAGECAAAHHEPGRHIGYLEAHIEQGPSLEAVGDRIGVVTTIVGSRNHEVDFIGQQNHAGTTPTQLRRDAGRALVEFAHAIDARFRELAAERTVWTIGRMSVVPGASSIIPGRACLTLQYRDADVAVLAAFDAVVDDVAADVAARTGVQVDVGREISPVDPAAMDAAFVEQLGRAAEQTAPGAWAPMPSAAIHDAMFLAEVMPAGMLFVPSIGGISHDFAEDTDDDDLALGCQTIAIAAERIARNT